MNIAAFDIGGTALKMGVMTREGTLLEKESSHRRQRWRPDPAGDAGVDRRSPGV
jgi:predicted NBD/HSP70 family sugar kinase